MHTFTVLSLIVVSVFKYSFGIRILWNLSCTKSLNVLYTQLHSPLNSIRSWTVIRSHNLAERAPVHRIITVQITNIALYSVQLHQLQPRVHITHVSLSAASAGQRKQFIELTCGLTGLGLARVMHWTALEAGTVRTQPGQGTGLGTNNPCLHSAWQLT